MATKQKKQAQGQDMMNLQDLLFLCLGKWHWFVLSVAVSVGVGIYIVLSTPPTYTRSAKVLVKDEKTGSGSRGGSSGDLSSMGIVVQNSNIRNEMGIMTSPDIMREVVSRLHLEMVYQIQGRFHNHTLYGPTCPVTVSLPDLDDNASAGFTLSLNGTNKYRVSNISAAGQLMETVIDGIMGDTISTPMGAMVVTPGSTYGPGTKWDLLVRHVPVGSMAGAVGGSFSVTHKEDAGNIITLTYNDVSPHRAEDILNTIIAVYNDNWVKDKNQTAVSTSYFINDRLALLEDELGDADYDISSFRSEHMMTGAGDAASAYVSRAEQAMTSIQQLNHEVYMANYIRNYLTNDANRNQMIPSMPGTEAGAMSSQVGEYNTLIMNRASLVSHSSETNPLAVEMDRTLAALRQTMITSIDNLLFSLNAQLSTYQSNTAEAKAQIASSPGQAKHLLSEERQQKVKESLYLFLLQKREENEISQAFTAYNTRVIVKPTGPGAPIAPVRNNILMVALAIGLALPIVIIFMKETMVSTVRGRKDLENLTTGMVGEIPLAYTRKGKITTRLMGKRAPRDRANTVVVKAQSRNVINEAFRVVRTNLEFMLGRGQKCHCVMFTSSNPNSGKTFISYNLATSLAIKGAKVLVVDLDLRKRSLSGYVGNPDTGVSDYLAGFGSDVRNLIVDAPDDSGLKVLPVGHMPPNPTELLYSDRMEPMLEQLRQEYEYIFFDCPPAEIVADADIIARHADHTVFVVRAGLFDKVMLPMIDQYAEKKRFNNIAILLNGTDSGSSKYGSRYNTQYGYRYGYRYGYSDKKKS